MGQPLLRMKFMAKIHSAEKWMNTAASLHKIYHWDKLGSVTCWLMELLLLLLSYQQSAADGFALPPPVPSNAPCSSSPLTLGIHTALPQGRVKERGVPPFPQKCFMCSWSQAAIWPNELWNKLLLRQLFFTCGDAPLVVVYQHPGHLGCSLRCITVLGFFP